MGKKVVKYQNQLKNFVEFFPVRLLLLHLRRSLLLLIFWILLFGTVGGYFFTKIGYHYLFQTPEYLYRVSPLSYLIMGLVLGLFVMAFHISSYIFYSYRFPFLATLSRPLYIFSINNSIIPISFYLYYTVIIVIALNGEGFGFFQILLSVLGLYFGTGLTVGLTLTYFFSTNKSLHIEGMEGLEKSLRAIIRADRTLEGSDFVDSKKVKTYLRNFYRIRLTRQYKHYTDQQKLDVLQKHHVNAAIYFLTILAFMFALSLFVLNPIFQIPAGASMVLILTIYIMIIGALYSRFKTWTMSLTIVAFIVLNYLSGVENLQKVHKAFGLNYETQAEYSIQVIDSLTSPTLMAQDKQKMIGALENWRAKFPKDKPPKLVIINSSGGGLRSTLWSLVILQKLDSLTQNKFLENTFLITGSSGGMLGTAYYRELKYREKQGERTGIYRRAYYDRMGKDFLNAVGVSMAVNDLFFPIKKVEVGGKKYRMDRGFAWERRLIEVTDSILDKRLIDYYQLEYNAEMPLMILSPMVINEGRRMLISPQDLSFLARNHSSYSEHVSYEIDGIEFMRFFKNQNSGELRFTTALRMSATFPFITPLVSLPCKPRIELIDAGVRDNDGFNLGMHFIHEFKDWIEENTAGVVVVKLMANSLQEISIKQTHYKTRLDAFAKPITGVISSFNNLQEFDYSKDLRIAESWVNFPFDIYSLELINKGDDISLSWHLTNREKDRIYEKALSEKVLGKMKSIKNILETEIIITSTDSVAEIEIEPLKN